MAPPSVGRIVHFTPRPEWSEGYGPGPCAAIVVAVNDDGTAGLVVFPPVPLGRIEGAEHGRAGVYHVAAESADGPLPGHWHWPPRVGP